MLLIQLIRYRCSQIGSALAEQSYTIRNVSVENKKSNLKSIQRTKQEMDEGYPKSKGLLSVAKGGDISLMNEKEQNCCKNEIIVHSHLDDVEQNKITTQNKIEIKESPRRRHEKQREHSMKLRYILHLKE